MATTIPFGAKPTNTIPFNSQPVAQSAPAKSLSDSIWDTIGGVGNALGSALGTKPLGEAIGNSVGTGLVAAKEALKGNSDIAGGLLKGAATENDKNMPKIVGSAVNAIATPASLAVGAPESVLRSAAQYAGLGAIQGGAQSLANGNDPGQIAKDAAISGGIGGVAGGAFNLLGKVASKVAAPIVSVTSGVPKTAIEQAGVNPSVTKQGVKMTVDEVRSKAVSSLQSLYNDLNKEHAAVSGTLGDTADLGFNSTASQNLTQKAREIAQKFKVFTTPGSEGLSTDFSKSAIVSGGEERVVNKALQTISTWDDFSDKGLQALNQRVNALKNFDEGAVTKSSAIVGKIHNEIGDLIDKTSPALSTLNKNYSVNKKVLDNISDVIGADAKDPVAIQGAVSRLDNIFKENKDEYVNIIRQLGQRSGVDYLSLLAGGEFQKLLPGYIRSAVAVGSIGGAGAVASNPLSLLLLPLFSPRAVGVAARNAPVATKAASQITRAATTQAIQKTVPKQAEQ